MGGYHVLTRAALSLAALVSAWLFTTIFMWAFSNVTYGHIWDVWDAARQAFFVVLGLASMAVALASGFMFVGAWMVKDD